VEGWIGVAAGAGLLFAGGELLVVGASRLARAVGLISLVIGLTVVAFGTSSPELAATLVAALRGSPEIAVGTVVGSNVANLSLILGACALVAPLITTARFLKRELPFMIGVGALFVLTLLNGRVSRAEGVVLLALLAVYLLVLLRGAERPEVEEEYEREAPAVIHPVWSSALRVVAGLALLVLGAHVLVGGATDVARAFGVSERVIGLTLVAIGTSLPELASALVAAWRGEGDMVLGNLVGSNVFNVLGILAVTAITRPLAVAWMDIWVDLAVMVGISLLVLPFLATGLRLGRREGLALLVVYAIYVAWLYRL
jgi:cation:H+ antiporter